MAEIWEVRCRYRLLNTEPEQCAENTHTFLLPGGLGSMEKMRDAMAQAWAPIVHLMHIDVMWEGILLRRMEPHGTGLIRLKFDEPIPGQVGGVPFPTSTAVEVLRDTGVYGRANIGRWWIPWLTGEMMDLVPHNEIREDAAVAILGAIDTFTYLINGHNAAGVNAIPVVYSRRSAAGGTHWNQVNRYRVVRNLRTLAKRGRRTEACPPFESDHFYSGGMGIGTCLQNWGYSTTFARTRSKWKFKSLSLGNGLGNAEPPEGWNQPDFDASGWSDKPDTYTPSPPVLVPGSYPTTHCVPGPSFRYGMLYPDYWEAPPDLGLPWSPTHAEFQLPWWVVPPSASATPDTIPRDGHILMVTDIDWRPETIFFTAELDFNAIDSICIWLNGELIVEQLDGEVVYPVFPPWQTITLSFDPARVSQRLAILVRSHHTPPTSYDVCTPQPQTHSNRYWHIYSDCGWYDALCLPSVFAFQWDQFQRCCAFVSLQLRAEWYDPPVPEESDGFLEAAKALE